MIGAFSATLFHDGFLQSGSSKGLSVHWFSSGGGLDGFFNGLMAWPIFSALTYNSKPPCSDSGKFGLLGLGSHRMPKNQ